MTLSSTVSTEIRVIFDLPDDHHPGCWTRDAARRGGEIKAAGQWWSAIRGYFDHLLGGPTGSQTLSVVILRREIIC